MQTAAAHPPEALAHLNPSVRGWLQQPNDARIAFIQSDHWIAYTMAEKAIKHLQNLMNYARGSRMPGCLIIGKTDTGKSTILKRFRDLHQPNGLAEIDDSEEEIPRPVIYMEMPTRIRDEGDFWSALLDALAVPHRASATVTEKRALAKSVMSAFQVRILLIDEADFLLLGTPSQQRERLAMIKSLSNQLQLPIVFAGTETAEAAFNTDKAVAGRYPPFELPLWRPGEEYLRFLASYERILPLAQPSGLATLEIARRLFQETGSTIGPLSRLLKEAARSAIQTGTERIDIPAIEAGLRSPLFNKWASADQG